MKPESNPLPSNKLTNLPRDCTYIWKAYALRAHILYQKIVIYKKILNITESAKHLPEAMPFYSHSGYVMLKGELLAHGTYRADIKTSRTTVLAHPTAKK